jgi:hypothetical protein
VVGSRLKKKGKGPRSQDQLSERAEQDAALEGIGRNINTVVWPGEERERVVSKW